MTKKVTEDIAAHIFTFNQQVIEGAFIGLVESDTDLTKMTTSGLRYVESTAITLWSDLFGSKQPNYTQMQDWTADWLAAAKRCALSDEVRANVAATVDLAEVRSEELSQADLATRKQRDGSEKLIALADAAKSRALLFRRKLIDQWRLLYNFETPLKAGGTVTIAEDEEKIKDAKEDVRDKVFGKDSGSGYKQLGLAIRTAISNSKSTAVLEFIETRYDELDVELVKMAQAANWVKPTSE